MKSIKIDFQHFNTDIGFKDADIVCTEITYQPGKVIGCSMAYIQVTDNSINYDVSVKFEWIDSVQQPGENDFCFIAETDMLFFRSMNQWGVINVPGKCLKKHEGVYYLPFIYKHDAFVLIVEELEAISLTLNGNVIDRVPIDPPYEIQEFEDRIEYTSHVYGHQVLKTR